MKRLSTALIFGFVISAFCFAQTQRGNASYNLSKEGISISHPSLSFNTHVRVTNLRNNRSVEAIVNGRIPINAERIADISHEAGDALQMDKDGMTPVEIAILPARTPASAAAPAQTPVQDSAPQPAAQQPAKAEVPAPAPKEQNAPPPPAPPVQTLTDIRYIPVPEIKNCCPWPYILAAIILLILATILLIILLALLLRRLFRWRPEYHPLWLRRRYWSGKKKRRGMRKYEKKQ
jgi:hypothetical protein